MKEWNEAIIEELKIGETANGLAPNDNFDDTWVQVNSLWYRPGHGEENSRSGVEATAEA